MLSISPARAVDSQAPYVLIAETADPRISGSTSRLFFADPIDFRLLTIMALPGRPWLLGSDGLGNDCVLVVRATGEAEVMLVNAQHAVAASIKLERELTDQLPPLATLTSSYSGGMLPACAAGPTAWVTTRTRGVEVDAWTEHVTAFALPAGTAKDRLEIPPAFSRRVGLAAWGKDCLVQMRMDLKGPTQHVLLENDGAQLPVDLKLGSDFLVHTAASPIGVFGVAAYSNDLVWIARSGGAITVTRITCQFTTPDLRPRLVWWDTHTSSLLVGLGLGVGQADTLANYDPVKRAFGPAMALHEPISLVIPVSSPKHRYAVFEPIAGRMVAFMDGFTTRVSQMPLHRFSDAFAGP